MTSLVYILVLAITVLVVTVSVVSIDLTALYNETKRPDIITVECYNNTMDHSNGYQHCHQEILHSTR